jgi:hypothetical protein
MALWASVSRSLIWETHFQVGWRHLGAAGGIALDFTTAHSWPHPLALATPERHHLAHRVAAPQTSGRGRAHLAEPPNISCGPGDAFAPQPGPMDGSVIPVKRDQQSCVMSFPVLHTSVLRVSSMKKY